MKPHKVLLFVYLVFGILLLLAFFFPQKGVDLGCCTLRFVTIKEIFSIPEKKELAEPIKQEIKIAEQLLKQATKDFEPPKDTKIKKIAEEEQSQQIVEAEELKKNIVPIEFKNEKARKNFYKLFSKLIKAKKNNVRILHYGDSQIEADRITSFIRYKLQKKFGGYGPGMIPPVNFVNFFSIKQQWDDSWERYSIMQKNKNEINHNKYGILVSFARYKTDTTDKDKSQNSLIFEKAQYSYSNTKRFDKLTIYYGNVHSNIIMQIYTNDKIFDFTTLKKGDFAIYTTVLPKNTEKVELKFSGEPSPDLYAVSFDGINGISVDNIAIRGSAGTFFTKIDQAHLKKFYNSMNLGLIILEFGGNAIPYLKKEEDCEKYGKYFEAQLKVIKKIAPQVPILVIGPADMSTKQETKFVTYQFLEKTINEMKKASFNQGCAFWDMYKAMGGKNSMPSWVEAKLATTDYTHFTSKGAVVIANMLHNAIMYEYENFINKK